MRDADREARRVDRQLDREHAAAPPAAAGSAAGPPDGDVWEAPWWETARPVRSAGSDEREPSP
jgi:hypothetical protein